MHHPFAPLIAIAPTWHSLHRRRRPGLRSPQCPLPREVSASSPSAPPKPTPTTQTTASPSGVAPDAVLAAGCQPELKLFPAPGPWPLAPIRETHLAKNPLPMRLPTSANTSKPLKNRSLQPHK
jgi:hypothetical protein